MGEVERGLEAVKTLIHTILEELRAQIRHKGKVVTGEQAAAIIRDSRYTTSTFLRMKLGDELAKREVAPHLYESKDEAHRHLTGK
ncbi:MAG TPA: hypothetical protein VFG29_12415 [Syntrophales bacterium]|nr:hypothetical protein [Syntrophales bacterium]